MKNKEEFYKTFTKRNIGILTWREQLKIKNKRVAILGCGGGSEVARQLVGSGFTNYILADYDNVELHNLNRQFFFQEDIRSNKAVALAKNMKMINPNLNIRVIPRKVEIKDVASIVNKSDIIIDAMPPEESLKQELQINRVIRLYDDKYHIYFLDIVWGAKAMVFSNKSQTLECLMGLDDGCSLNCVDSLSLEVLTKPYMYRASKEMKRVGTMMYKRELNYFPQMSITISLASSMVSTLCIYLSIGKNVKVAPEVYSVDFYKQFTGNQ
ncbi:ThiF family adenylyltransferase [Candidatus Woesebacteria bacterium]|nr:MAG: ThiF family adenylyltransferase [Candidatus Woesebacteria bacterium]